MKVICILQNAWGDRRLPLVFAPNELNKSDKTIRRKLLAPDDVMMFCNTTGEVTRRANIKASIDTEHFQKVLKHIHSSGYDLILVCGVQAAKAVGCTEFSIPVLFIPHPAVRNLSNVILSKIKTQINETLSASKTSRNPSQV